MAEERQTQIALESELFRLLVETTKDYAVFVVGLDGRVVTWNAGAERVLGYTEAEIIGRDSAIIFTPEDRRQGVPEAEIRTALRDGRSTDDRWHVRKDGTRIWVSGVLVLLKEEDGRPRAFAKVMRDFTEAKLAADALRESEERLRVALDAADMGTWLWRIPTDEQILDDSLRRLMGLPPGDEVKTLEGFLRAVHAADRDRVRGEFERCLRDGGGFSVEFRVTWPDGSVHWLRDQGRAYAGPDGNPLFITGAAMDITDRKRDEQALRDADRRKDEFLALLAHELRNPLAPVRNGLQVIRMSPDRAVREQAQEMMDRQLTHMVRLIDDLLDISRITRNKMELRAPVALADVVSSAVETARPSIDSAGHELDIALPAEPVVLDADLTRLAQVFGNLLTNSAKYTPPGGRIALAAEQQGNQVVVAVRDTGMGIPADALPHIFDMFSQVDRTLERSTGGLGIGLAPVKGLTEMHGGTVVAESPGPGQGTAFTVRLPLHTAATSEPPAAAPTNGASEVAGRKILVVDDNRDSAESMAEMLALFGNEVTVAHDGIEAVEAAERVRPEIILMDVGMPRLNGYGATRRIRDHAWGEAITIVALTGWGQEGDRNQSKAAGCDGHLVKPVSLADLQKMLGECDHSARKN